MSKPVEYSDEELLAVRTDVKLHFEVYGFLESREKILRRADAANNIQTQLFDAYNWCQANNQQCSIIGLKPRKDGMSTAAIEVLYHHCQNHKAAGVIIGTDGATGDTLMRMLVRYAENDRFPWKNTFNYTKSTNHADFSHGSEIDRDTATDPKAGRAATTGALVATEVAHWPSSGVRAADETMLSMLNSMPDISNRLRIVDSTANGASGWFFETYTGAVTLAERKTGKRGNGWIKIFEPWHTSPLRAIPVTTEDRAAIDASLTEREKAGIIEYAWTHEQIAWRRQKISEDCGSSELKFDQEFPANEMVAFQTSGSPRFDLVGCARLVKMAQNNFARGKIGSIEGEKGNFRFREDAQGYVWMIEAPIPGCEYCCIGDYMGGEQTEGAIKRDKHAVGILRRGYFEGTLWHPTELVAAIHVEGANTADGGCMWDHDVISERQFKLASIYGKCIHVPEANNDGKVIIAFLKALGAFIWQREDLDHVNLGKKMKKPGFLTGPATKAFWIAAMAQAIRMAGLEGREEFICHYLPWCVQFGTFVRKPNGKSCEAQRGCFDDGVAAIGIGLYVDEWTRMPGVIQPQEMSGYQGGYGDDGDSGSMGSAAYG